MNGTQSGDGMTRVVVFVDPETEALLEETLGYGDSKSEYIRESLRARLLDESDEYDDYDHE
jgi:hypothetical protein